MSWLKSLPLSLWLTALLLAGGVLGHLPLAAIGNSISSLSSGQWLGWTALNLSIISLSTQRWQLLTDMLKLPINFSELLLIRQAGQAVSFITPGPQFGGEPLQIYWLHRGRQAPLHRSLLALGLDRFYELWINFSVLLLAVLLLASPAGNAGDWRSILSILAFVLLALSLFGRLMLQQPQRILAWLNRLTRQWQHHPRLQNSQAHWQQLTTELKQAVARQKRVLLQAFMLSLYGWAGLIAELWLLLSFFGLETDFSAFLLIFVSMRLSFLLPLPGGVGSLEAALFWGFHTLNLPLEAAMGLIALMRLRDAVLLLSGFICLRLLQRR
ncbi:flippase-like domain-containing protein [Methylomonas sp. SURF-2]|uniref:Flippase-like domain-containing protein n=1 Tax=Methylomonas subterranea TaxID=2952225 RepID=A0ABT1TLM2_9GAMM|nr:lysylphosphatidylglycerol synthase transmembrane domain-containing protein [Methylomonas sp. SURF-2]MCQ8106209.1 flippase-like domain-containing protein [Methylomonas sp. SURF-2]